MDSPLDALLRLLPSLAIIVAALLAARWWLARNGGTGAVALRVTGRAPLTKGAAVAVVEVEGRRFLVGAGDGGVRLLCELPPAAPEPSEEPSVPVASGMVERLRRGSTRMQAVALVVLAAGALLLAGGTAQAQPVTPPATPVAPTPVATGGPAVPEVAGVPDVGIDVTSDDPALSRTVILVLLLTVGSVAPGLLLLMTTFTRFVVVLGLAKNALGLQTIPPSQVLVGLALFLAFFTMAPVLREVNEAAVQPLLNGQIGQGDAFEAGFDPLRRFMLAQTRPDDLELFVDLSGSDPTAPADVPATTLIPAFVISELRTAFLTGFVIFIPFLVIDLVVAAVLMSLGMVMLPPIFISLPLKLLLFVLVDGWVLIVSSAVGTVNGVSP